jgi:hypothetical protein
MSVRALAYAETSHASQGRTVDRALLLLDGPTDTRGVYVPMSRGRLSNDAFVVLNGEQTTRDVLTQALSQHWIDEPAIARRADLQHHQPHGTGQQRGAHVPLGREKLRELFERQETTARSLTRADVERRGVIDKLAGLDYQCAQLEQRISDAQQRIARAHQTLAQHDRLGKRHRWRFEIDNARNIIRNTPRDINRLDHELSELRARRPDLQQRLEQIDPDAGPRPTLPRQHRAICHQLDADIKVRSERIAKDPPAYLTARLGSRSDHGPVATLWDETAARIDQHRTAFSINDTRNPLGTQPARCDWSAYATSHRAAAEAWQRLDRAFGREAGIELSRGLSIGL